MKAIGMTTQERRAASSLAGIYAIRMLGMFMILPVFALYAEHLAGVTPVLVGIAIGIYGLSQAVLQIPFGMASDRFGRKPVIALGMVIFAIGSAVAGMAHSIHAVILGRALQGAGAVAAAVMALVADLTREENRTKAMAFIGMSIGTSFIIAMVLGPILNHWIGVPGIFWLTSGLALLGIVMLYTIVPTPQSSRHHSDAEPVPGQFGRILRDGQLLRLDLGIMVLHLTLTANFVAIPLILRDDLHFATAHHWMLYLPVMVLAMALSVPFIIIGEKRHKLKQVLLGAIATMAVAEVGIAEFGLHSLGAMAALLLLFFTGFNLLEASLPSLVSKFAPAEAKGTAMGVYNTSQFIGAFIGGAAGGWFHGHYGYAGVFLFTATVIAVWWVAALGMRQPRYLASYLLNVGIIEADRAALLSSELLQVQGVVEAVVKPEDGVAYLKVESKKLDTDALQAYAVAQS